MDRRPIVTRTSLPGDPKDEQARYIEAAIDGILVGCIYLPNGNPQPGPKFEYKLAWFRRLHAHARKLMKQGVPVVLAGDYNVAPTGIDIYPTSSTTGAAEVRKSGAGGGETAVGLHPPSVLPPPANRGVTHNPSAHAERRLR